jgi:hypothetical protein
MLTGVWIAGENGIMRRMHVRKMLPGHRRSETMLIGFALHSFLRYSHPTFHLLQLTLTAMSERYGSERASGPSQR